MKITAMSDLHGNLPEISGTDLLIIAGDFSPLNIQQNNTLMEVWIRESLIPYFQKIPAKKIVLIAGNHDFVCLGKNINFWNFTYEYDFKLDFLQPLLREFKLEEKVSYLCNESVIYNDIRIYGCPYVRGLNGWAFSNGDELDIYSKIKKCDILVTHQPPLYGGLDETFVISDKNKKSFASSNNNSNLKEKMKFGSESLLKRIKFIKPKYVFCGHIHEGNHNKVELINNNKSTTFMYNVSLLDEDYNQLFNPLEIIY